MLGATAHKSVLRESWRELATAVPSQWCPRVCSPVVTAGPHTEVPETGTGWLGRDCQEAWEEGWAGGGQTPRGLESVASGRKVADLAGRGRDSCRMLVIRNTGSSHSGVGCLQPSLPQSPGPPFPCLTKQC